MNTKHKHKTCNAKRNPRPPERGDACDGAARAAKRAGANVADKNESHARDPGAKLFVENATRAISPPSVVVEQTVTSKFGVPNAQAMFTLWPSSKRTGKDNAQHMLAMTRMIEGLLRGDETAEVCAATQAASAHMGWAGAAEHAAQMSEDAEMAARYQAIALRYQDSHIKAVSHLSQTREARRVREELENFEAAMLTSRGPLPPRGPEITTPPSSPPRGLPPPTPAQKSSDVQQSAPGQLPSLQPPRQPRRSNAAASEKVARRVRIPVVDVHEDPSKKGPKRAANTIPAERTTSAAVMSGGNTRPSRGPKKHLVKAAPAKGKRMS